MTDKDIFAQQNEVEECRDRGEIGGAAEDPEGTD